MRCLIVAPELAPYVRRDAEILGRDHEVELLACHRPPSFRRLPGAVARCDAVLIWFAKLHALAAVSLARTRRRPAVVIAAGDDVCSLPEVGYGMLTRRHKAWCPRNVLADAHRVTFVSKHARRSAAAHVPAAQHWPVVYHGFADRGITPRPAAAREPIVVTIARITRETLRIKGLDLLRAAAWRLPQVRFVLIGAGQASAEAEFDRDCPPNLQRVGWQDQQQIVGWCSRAKVYLQPSLTESFGAAVAEAMLCGAIPVVSRRGALPEVVGDCGIYIEDLCSDAVAGAVSRGLAVRNGVGAAARERILTHFSYERRRAGLEAALGDAQRRCRC